MRRFGKMFLICMALGTAAGLLAVGILLGGTIGFFLSVAPWWVGMPAVLAIVSALAIATADAVRKARERDVEVEPSAWTRSRARFTATLRTSRSFRRSCPGGLRASCVDTGLGRFAL